MKIEIFAPGFIKQNQLDQEHQLEVKEGASIGSVFEQLGIPMNFRRSFTFLINDQLADWSSLLCEGDKVTFLFPISGG